eukprot:6196150-Pleurochrysis_carterae.AAC.1
MHVHALGCTCLTYGSMHATVLHAPSHLSEANTQARERTWRPRACRYPQIDEKRVHMDADGNAKTAEVHGDIRGDSRMRTHTHWRLFAHEFPETNGRMHCLRMHALLSRGKKPTSFFRPPSFSIAVSQNSARLTYPYPRSCLRICVSLRTLRSLLAPEERGRCASQTA